MSEPPSDNPAADSRAELLKEYGFAALVGLLLLLNVTGAFKTIFGLDTAILITALAGYKTFYNSVSALLEKRISADIALCVAVIAALAVALPRPPEWISPAIPAPSSPIIASPATAPTKNSGWRACAWTSRKACSPTALAIPSSLPEMPRPAVSISASAQRRSSSACRPPTPSAL